MSRVSIERRKVSIAELSRSDPNLSPAEKKILADSFRYSDPMYEATVDDRLVCVWGLVPPTVMSDRAYLWMHTTEDISEHTFLLVRYSQIVIDKMLEEFSTLTGHVLTSNEKGIKWLKWLGASFGRPDGVKIPFTIRRH